MDHVFIPVCEIKDLWDLWSSSLVVASSLSAVCPLCLSMYEFNVCVCWFQWGPLFVNLGLEFVIADLRRVTCLFASVISTLGQVEDVYLLPLLGWGYESLFSWWLHIPNILQQSRGGKPRQAFLTGSQAAVGLKFTEPLRIIFFLQHLNPTFSLFLKSACI